MGGVVKEIIQVFVDSLPHVPAHRRLPLLTHLLTSVGVSGMEGQLHTALGLLLEKQVVGEEVCTIGYVQVLCFFACANLLVFIPYSQLFILYCLHYRLRQRWMKRSLLC